MQPSSWALLFLASGCVVREQVHEIGDGTVEFSWQVGSGGCGASGITEVEATLGDRLAVFDCDAGKASMSAAPGNHELVLRGLDEGGVARYDGTTNVHVAGDGHTVVPTLVLGARLADLTVSWFFENGRLCGGNGVTDVELTVFEDDYVADSVETGCDDGIEDLEALEAGAYTVSLLGLDAQGTAVFAGSSQVLLDKGDAQSVEIELYPR